MPRKTLQTTESTAIAAVLRFLALKDITSTQQVEDLLVPAAAALGATRFQILKPGEHPAYVENQRIARGWLTQILKRPTGRKRDALLREIKTWRDKAHASVRSDIVDGRFVDKLSVDVDGVQALIGWALARLCTDGTVQPDNIRKCKGCEIHFIQARGDHETCSTRCRVRVCRSKDK
jgi:hypothetical protein